MFSCFLGFLWALCFRIVSKAAEGMSHFSFVLFVAFGELAIAAALDHPVRQEVIDHVNMHPLLIF